jgi:hypothetical protein
MPFRFFVITPVNNALTATDPALGPFAFILGAA